MNPRTYLLQICLIKQNVVKLKSDELRDYKRYFYSNEDFTERQKDIFWEYIWNDLTYLEAFLLLK